MKGVGERRDRLDRLGERRENRRLSAANFLPPRQDALAEVMVIVDIDIICMFIVSCIIIISSSSSSSSSSSAIMIICHKAREGYWSTLQRTHAENGTSPSFSESLGDFPLHWL